MATSSFNAKCAFLYGRPQTYQHLLQICPSQAQDQSSHGGTEQGLTLCYREWVPHGILIHTEVSSGKKSIVYGFNGIKCEFVTADDGAI